MIWAIALTATFALTARAPAEPTWWSGSCAEAKRLARQTNRWMFLFFESPNSINCRRLDEETWPKLDPVQAEKNYIWIRLNPGDHAKFFTHFEVYATPELIVVDQDGAERSRLRGFVDAATLMTMLDKVFKAAASEKRIMLNDGTIMSLAAYNKEVEGNRQAHENKHFYYYGFDEDATREFKTGGRWSFPVPGSMRVEPAQGRYHSGCLFIGADQTQGATRNSRPAAEARVNLSSGSGGQAVGSVSSSLVKLRATFSLRSVSMPERVTEVARVSVVPRGASANVPEALNYTTTIISRESNWITKTIQTDPFVFTEKDVHLTLWVDEAEHGFYVDDLQVDLITEGGDSIAQAAPVMERDPLAGLEVLTNVADSRDLGLTLFTNLDLNRDRRLDARELDRLGKASVDLVLRNRPFSDVDLDGNGYLHLDEWRKLSSTKRITQNAR